MNIQLSAQTSWPAAVALSGTYWVYIYIYKVLHIYGHILYRYCSLDDSVGNAIVGIYKMIFIFIKLENDNSNKQQRPLPSPVSAPGTLLPSPCYVSSLRLTNFQLQSAASAVSQQLKLCSGIVQITSPGRVSGRCRGEGGRCVGVVLCPVSEQLLNALKFIHSPQLGVSLLKMNIWMWSERNLWVLFVGQTVFTSLHLPEA